MSVIPRVILNTVPFVAGVALACSNRFTPKELVITSVALTALAQISKLQRFNKYPIVFHQLVIIRTICATAAVCFAKSATRMQLVVAATLLLADKIRYDGSIRREIFYPWIFKPQPTTNSTNSNNAG